ncbi:MAG TPA: nuclear transport factor 2 family protein [Pseudosphingobacterium sp.]|nr:nuclear transport factor 2 family protein [Pseudosphingobacterium sp.]
MTKKEIAQDFLKLASKGESREAFQRYVGNGFKHHNVFFKGDAQTLMTAMEENAKKSPDIRTEIHHVLEEGPMVAVHSHVRKSTDDLGAALMHIFRFDNKKIVELWDFGQPVPADTVNENGMF